MTQLTDLGPIGVCDKWNLIERVSNLEKMPLDEWRKIATSIQKQYSELPKPRLGSVMLDLYQSHALLDATQPLETLAAYALLFDTIWLPDPLYSFLVKTATVAWRRLPESGSTFMGPIGISTNWKQLWDRPPEERRSAIARFAPTIRTLGALRSLVDLGALRFIPWEILVEKDPHGFRTAVLTLSKNLEVEKITTRFEQERYSLGVRVGAIGLMMKDGIPSRGIAPKTNLHLADKRPIVSTGLLHGVLSGHG